VVVNSKDNMNYKLIDFVVAFEKWENDFRINPSLYVTSEEVKAMNVSEVSKDRASYFMALLESKEQVTVH